MNFLFTQSSSLSSSATDASSNPASLGSTPPTTVDDSASQHSDTSKQELLAVPSTSTETTTAAVAENAENAAVTAADATASSPPRRARRARVSAPIYNLNRLSVTSSIRRFTAADEIAAAKRRRTISGDTLIGSVDATRSPSNKAHNLDAFEFHWSPGSLNTPRTRRQAKESPRAFRATSRQIGASVSNFGSKISKITKRSSKAVGKGVSKLSRELMRLQDTKEFAGIDDKPVLHTVWANGKFFDPKEAAKEAAKKAKLKEQAIKEEEEEEQEKDTPEPITNTRVKQVKKYLATGLYAGQEVPDDMSKGLTIAEKKKLAQLPELAKKPRVNNVMPPTLYTGFRTLIAGRDFKLPYLTCNPLPPGQPKPDEWKKMTKNRFIGDSKDYWRKSDHFGDYQSKCVCTADDGCGESCQNRIMLYECDEMNCNVGKENCLNRAFANLTARRAKGGKYRVGVEVIKTSDRGYGVRSNRCFRPHQIIMEYAGEIITEAECERRMNEIYKNNDCYYLMSFDQNMIIDATTGSIARFVNHSCNPNCRMIKWIVSGQPRMALFAGDRPITTGDELTYDYNFDPFSAKNVQKCLCGSENCRGVLGPRPKEVKLPKTDLKKVVKATVKAGKRKLKELVGDDGSPGGNKTKKRKIQKATGVKRSLSSVSVKAAKGAATVIKKGVSTLTKKKTVSGAGTGKKRVTASALLKKTTSKSAIKALAKKGGRVKQMQVSSRSSSLTIVAMSDENIRAGLKGTNSKKGTPVKKSPGKKSPSKGSARKVPSKKITPKIRRTSGKPIKLVTPSP